MSVLLSNDEQEILDLLGVCFTKFATLEILHPDHINEFKLAIHSAQRIIMCRPVRCEMGVNYVDKV